MQMLVLLFGHLIDRERARDIHSLRKENRALRRHFDKATLRLICQEVHRRMGHKIQTNPTGSKE